MEGSESQFFPERIATERLILRRQRRSDAQAVRVAVEESHEELSRWLNWAKDIPSVDAIDYYISKTRANWELGDQYLFHVFDHADRLLGVCGLEKIDWSLRGFEIGYWLRTSAVGKGYMSEAVACLEREVFGRCRGRRLAILCDRRNHRSSSIPRRLDYCLEGVLRNERLDTSGEPQDTMVWSKIA